MLDRDRYDTLGLAACFGAIGVVLLGILLTAYTNNGWFMSGAFILVLAFLMAG